jgi:AcrR family transcriptional regulator
VNRRSEVERQPHKLRDRIRETTAQEILAAAEDVFAEAGLHAARMDDIAARAGVSVGTLYNHFQDRDALLAGLMAARKGELLAALEAAEAAPAPGGFRERLRATLVTLLTHCDRHRRFFNIMFQREAEQSQGKPAGGRKQADAMRDLLDRLDKLMKQGVREKALRPDMAELAPVFLLGMFRALVIRSFVLGQGGGLVDEVDRLERAFLGGLGEAAA